MKTSIAISGAAMLALAALVSTAEARMLGGNSLSPRTSGGDIRLNVSTIGSTRTFSPDGRTFSPDGKTPRKASHYKKPQDWDPPPDNDPDPKKGGSGKGSTGSGGTTTGSGGHYPYPHHPHPHWGPYGYPVGDPHYCSSHPC